MTAEIWRGCFKVVEECSELTTVIGKLGPFPDGNHPDGAGDLTYRLEEELADVFAAGAYFMKTNGLDQERIFARAKMKAAKFQEWGLTGIKT